MKISVKDVKVSKSDASTDVKCKLKSEGKAHGHKYIVKAKPEISLPSIVSKKEAKKTVKEYKKFANKKLKHEKPKDSNDAIRKLEEVTDKFLERTSKKLLKKCS